MPTGIETSRPAVDAVWIGSARRPAGARFLQPDEAASVFADYERAHRKAAAKLMDMMHKIPMVAFVLA